MKSGDYNFIMQQAQYSETINMSFKDKRMKVIANKLEGQLYKIMFYSLLLSLLGYYFNKK